MAVRSVRVKVGERWYTVRVKDLTTSPISVDVDGETFYVDVEGISQTRETAPKPNQQPAPRTGPPIVGPDTPSVSEKVIRSPMPGRVLAVNVRPGDSVSSGQEVCVVEAMKMEQSIRTPHEGTIKKVHVQPLQQVGTNDPLVELD